MYEIQDNSGFSNFTILGTVIPKKMLKIGSLREFFSVTEYNGKSISEEDLYNHIMKSEKGKKIILNIVDGFAKGDEEIPDDPPRENYLKMTKSKLLEVCQDLGIELTGNETKLNLVSLIESRNG